MTTRKERGPTPRTLTQAHDLLTQERPSPGASAEIWLRYYRRSAAVYAEVAEIDRGHHHEALYWANRERAKAEKIATGKSKGPASDHQQ
jgi:hypothetical protein